MEIKELIQWKDIPNYENLYQISNTGIIKSLKRKHGRNYSRIKEESILKPAIDKYGYEYIRLSKNGITKTYKVHRLVMLTFEGISDLEVNHKNGIKNDNYYSNLEYCTARENLIHSYKTKIRKPAYKKVKCIETNIVYEGIKVAAEKLNIHESGIWHQLNGDQLKTHGLTFKYIN